MQDEDLDGDFDPEQYDRKMGEIFNQDYYHVENEEQKPEFPYDPEIDDGMGENLFQQACINKWTVKFLCGYRKLG